MKSLPAYDQIIQGLSGVMSITGDPDTAPYRVGYPIADTIGGLTAAFAISAALADRSGNRGRFIDVSMLESVIATMGWVVSNHLMAGRDPKPMGNDNFTASPSGAFRTGNGLINIAANKQEQFEAVCRVVGRPNLIHDPRFATRADRLANRAALTQELESAFASRPANEWRSALNAAGVPAGEVLSVPDALDMPQIADRGMIGTFEDAPGVGRNVRLARTGIKLDGSSPVTETPPPVLGADTDALLTELGYDADAIKRLREDQAI